MEHYHIQVTHRATQHGTHEECRCEDAPRSTAGVRTHRGSKLEDTEDDHSGYRHFACECQGEGFIGIASDAVEVEEHQRSDRHAACGCAADGWLHPTRHAGEPSEPGPKAQ